MQIMIMETVFTPMQSLVGGLLIGLSAVLLMATTGRIMGATGVVAGLIRPASTSEFTWRAVLLAGMITGPLVVYALTGQMPEVQVPISSPMLIAGGLIVGIGVTLGSGCTSGHGVCGIARLSWRSIVATLIFMVTTGMTVFIIRHVIGG
jgi:uncharacterized membrane protein YedE/YeeE